MDTNGHESGWGLPRWGRGLWAVKGDCFTTDHTDSQAKLSLLAQGC